VVAVYYGLFFADWWRGGGWICSVCGKWVALL